MRVALELDREAAAYLGANPRRLRRNVGRDDEILMMRESGATLDEIGAVFGVSRERIRQLLARQGHTKTRGTDVDPILVLRAARAPGVTNLSAAAESVGIDRQAARRVVVELGAVGALQRLYRWRRESRQRAEAVQLLRAFQEKYGRAPTSIEIGFKQGVAYHPELRGVRDRMRAFGSYRAMFAAAGLASRPVGGHGHLGVYASRANPRTHCTRGHEFTEANTRRYGGHRRCLTCQKLNRETRRRPA